MLTKQTEIELSNEQMEEIVSWRRYLHQHPELSFQEHKTAAFLYETLSTFPNLEVTRPTETSVMAVLKGRNQERQSDSGLISMPCRSRKKPLFLLHPKMKVSCMLVGMTDIQLFCLVSPKH